jgi:methionine synthase II (cobalamin-independent)
VTHPALRPGTATSVGSLPFADPREAARVVVGELPDLPHLPELPGRGAGADLVGRTASLLVELAVDLQPSGWRIVDRPGRDQRRAAAFLREDLDALEEAAQEYEGPLKIQVAGPLTLAAALEKTRGDRVVGDHGARRDLTQSLAEGVAQHVAEVSRRLPRARVLLQVDEPTAPAVLGGQIPTVSGFGRLRSVEAVEATDLLRQVLAAATDGFTVVHCCASDVPLGVFTRAGAAALSFDLGLIGTSQYELLAESADAGVALWPGVVPSLRPPAGVTQPEALAGRVRRFWERVGLDAEAAAATSVVTPTCGLAGADPAWTREALRLARTTAAQLAEKAET